VREEFSGALRGDHRWAGDVVLTSGGRPVPCRATVSRYRGADGSDAGIVLVLVDAQEVVAREATLRETAEQLRDQAARDPLTRLWNRAYLAGSIEREIARVRRHGRPLTLLVADLDHFGHVNKVHGLQGGDEVLRGIAQAMLTAVRLGDVLTRYAGDEFCVLLPESGRSEGAEVGERLRQRVRSVRTPGTGGRPMTISIGLACTDEFLDVPSSAELFSLADRRLRLAKRLGGDRVVEADEADGTPVPAASPARPTNPG
jgi:diguanylate cyclase (GGDEF)-like protein